MAMTRKTCVRLTIAACTMIAITLVAALHQTNAGRQVASSQQPARKGHLKSRKPAPPLSQQTIYAPLAALDDPSRSELVLLNKGINTIPVQATIYNDDGSQLITTELDLVPGESRYVTMDKLAQDASSSASHWGGIQLSYIGHSMEVVAQITIQGSGSSGSVDVEFFERMDFSSTTLHAVWWKPKGATSTLFLGNTSSNKITAEITNAAGVTRQEEIEAHATKLIAWEPTFADSLKRRQGESVDSVTVQFIGMPGDLRAFGIVSDSNGYTAPLRFYDSATAIQQNLYATQLPLANSAIHLAVANLSNAPIVITPTFHLIGVQNAASIRLNDVTVLPHKATQLDVSDLASAANAAAASASTVELLNSGSPGALIGALTSTNQANRLTYDVPLRDSGKVGKSTGTYPIRFGSGYSNLITISNVSFKPLRFFAVLNVDSGPEYHFPMKSLESGESAVFDLNTLMLSKAPDPTGSVIPPDAKTGKFHWSLAQLPGAARLIGRNEVANIGKRIASSFSCTNCCPDDFEGPDLSNFGPMTVGIGWQGSSTVLESYYSTCYGNSWSNPVFASFSETVPGICPVSQQQEGTATYNAAAVGTTNISYPYEMDQWTWDGETCYGDQDTQSTISANFTVNPKILLGDSSGTDITGTTQSVVVGQQIVLYGSYSVPSGSTSVSVSWTIPGTGSNPATAISNYTVSSDFTSGGPVSLTSSQLTQQQTTFYWTVPTPANSPNTVKFTVNYKDSNNNAQSPSVQANFTVVGPASPNVITCGGNVPTGVCPNGTNGPLAQVAIIPGSDTFLALGNATPSNLGIVFNASATPPSGYSNSFLWVQLITANTIAITGTPSVSCVQETNPQNATGTGDDTDYPFGTGASVNDSPFLQLKTSYGSVTGVTEVNNNPYNLTMYLLWNSGLTNSIPIPLGSVSWQWSGDATYDQSSQTWSLKSASATANPFAAGNTYPSWTSLVTLMGITCH